MARVLDFNDSQSSASTPTIETNSFATFANDAAYEAANGAGSAGDIYYNTTDNTLRYYDAGKSAWTQNEAELNNATAADPTVSNDNTEGYQILSLWLNTSSGALFRATDVSTGAAVWQEIASDAVLDAHIANTSNPHSTDIDDVTPTTTKGDIIVENGTNAVRLAVGTDGHVLKANSATSEGVEWAAESGGGGGSETIVTKTASATLATTGEEIVEADATSGDITLTLPAVSGNANLRYKIVKTNSNANTVTIDPNAAETINGLSSIVMYGQYRDVEIVTDGTEWFIVSQNLINKAIVYDEKSNGTAGGTFTQGAWQTRDLNTIEGDSDFLSVSSNQITLEAGHYFIEASAPGHNVDEHKLRLRNTTDSTTDIVGRPIRSNAVADTGNSLLDGFITITAQKVFELQHRCGTTRGTDGFGRTLGSIGEVERYALVEITRLGDA